MEEKEEAGGGGPTSWCHTGEEDEEAATVDSGRQRVEAGPAFSPDGRTYLAAEAASECVAGSFQDIQTITSI